MVPKQGKNGFYIGKAWKGKGAPSSGFRLTESEQYKLTPGYKGGLTIYHRRSSRDWPSLTVYPEHATQGDYAKRWRGSWGNIKKFTEGRKKGAEERRIRERIRDVDCEIDMQVYRLYGISRTERSIVETVCPG